MGGGIEETERLNQQQILLEGFSGGGVGKGGVWLCVSEVIKDGPGKGYKLPTVTQIKSWGSKIQYGDYN